MPSAKKTIDHNGHTYSATVDSDNVVRVFDENEWIGTGRFSHGEIIDVAIELPEHVWDFLTANLHPVSCTRCPDPG